MNLREIDYSYLLEKINKVHIIERGYILLYKKKYEEVKFKRPIYQY